MRQAKHKTIMIMVTDEFKIRVKKAAAQDNKTMTGYVTDCLLADLNKRDKKNGTDQD